MSYDFGKITNVKKTRKVHRCEHCRTEISMGSAITTLHGKFEGDMYRYYVHPICQEAGNAWHKITDRYYDEYTWLCEEGDRIELEGWLLEYYPELVLLFKFKDDDR